MKYLKLPTIVLLFLFISFIDHPSPNNCVCWGFFLFKKHEKYKQVTISFKKH